MKRKVWGRDKAIMKCPSQFIESALTRLCKSGLQLATISLMTSGSRACGRQIEAEFFHYLHQ
jgi:hypothetical protein